MMLYRCVHCRPHYQWYGKVNRKTSRFFQACFISGAGAGDTAGMHLPVYKMNFPRKNPMKMAAMTTRREGREAVLDSRPRRLVEFDVMWSERGTFLILRPSSCNRGRGGMKDMSFHSRAGNSQQISSWAAPDASQRPSPPLQIRGSEPDSFLIGCGRCRPSPHPSERHSPISQDRLTHVQLLFTWNRFHFDLQSSERVVWHQLSEHCNSEWIHSKSIFCLGFILLYDMVHWFTFGFSLILCGLIVKYIRMKSTMLWLSFINTSNL